MERMDYRTDRSDLLSIQEITSRIALMHRTLAIVPCELSYLQIEEKYLIAMPRTIKYICRHEATQKLHEVYLKVIRDSVHVDIHLTALEIIE